MSSRGSSLSRSDNLSQMSQSEDEDSNFSRTSSLSRSSSGSIASSTSSGSPPGYQTVLLENHLKRSKAYPGLYPPKLTAAISNFLFNNETPIPDPYRTYHNLNKTFNDGKGQYIGELDHKSRRHGLGHMLYSSNDAFHGQWKKGQREGEGAFFWADTGSVYQGEWKGGERHGFGHFVFGSRRNDKLNGVVFSGNWSKGKILGRGTVSLVNEVGKVEKVPETVQSQVDNDNVSMFAKKELLQLFKKLSLWVRSSCVTNPQGRSRIKKTLFSLTGRFRAFVWKQKLHSWIENHRHRSIDTSLARCYFEIHAINLGCETPKTCACSSFYTIGHSSKWVGTFENCWAGLFKIKRNARYCWKCACPSRKHLVYYAHIRRDWERAIPE